MDQELPSYALGGLAGSRQTLLHSEWPADVSAVVFNV